ncbi:MAG: orotidine-5'-phosphate decarboxylase [Bacteriovoracaceae bacterium]|nr:orotidine-5'-phosphate decarboxylase [Bacteriovoracaceae bacterium]
MKSKVFVALDQTDWKQLEMLSSSLSGSSCGMKVGMELYYAHGPKAVEFLHSKGFKVFLDLKLHDIPTTVEKALKNLIKLPAYMFNVHAAGGSEMLKRAAEAVSARPDAKLIAVTQLTSTSESMMQSELKISGSLMECVLDYAKLTKNNGLHGVVCSAQEAQAIKKVCGPDFLCVTPGIRPKGVVAHDQKRLMTPNEALANGADYLVVGRAITEAKDPALALENLFKE